MHWNVFVGRQPIFDRNDNIYAYELLYRNSDQNEFPNIDPEKATLELLIHTFLTIGFDDVVNRTRSFINFSEKLLFENVVEQLNPRYVVIEILENMEVTPSLIAQLTRLKKQGFKIALDDFIINKQHLLYHELYQLIHIIKVDYKSTTKIERRQIEALRDTYGHIALLAEKIETKQEYEEAFAAGYLLFQGYYFAKPEIIKGKDIISNNSIYLRLFQKLNEENPDIDAITSIIKHDVSLSYKLLRHINSFAFEIPNRISSIKQAIVLMGLEETKKWMQILLLHHIGDGVAKGREKALIVRSLIRAKTCELVAIHKRYHNPDEYFLLGMFSLINVILNQGWEGILPRLSLSELVNDTLYGLQTEMKPYLRLVTAVETFDMDILEHCAEEIEVSVEKISNISLEAHRWIMRFEKNI